MLDLLGSSWFWLLFVAAMLLVRLRNGGYGGHGCCGGHAHECHQPQDATTPGPPQARRATHR